MIQHAFTLAPKSRGFHLITDEIRKELEPLFPKKALLHLFILHTSAGLCINENADPTVLHDFEVFFNLLAPEDTPGILHTMEGPDDMPAHIKSSLTGHQLHIPIQNHKMVLGTWQGIYLCEFRNHAKTRKLFATIYS